MNICLFSEIVSIQYESAQSRSKFLQISWEYLMIFKWIYQIISEYFLYLSQASFRDFILLHIHCWLFNRCINMDNSWKKCLKTIGKASEYSQESIVLGKFCYSSKAFIYYYPKGVKPIHTFILSYNHLVKRIYLCNQPTPS